MYNYFKSVTLSYKNTPINIREALSLNESDCKALLRAFRELDDITDIFILSTCNRTEVYFTSPHDYSHEVIQEIGQLKKIAKIQDYERYFKYNDNALEVVQHLFYVAMGLESQVVGDMQISNQVKNAYQWAADLGTPGPFLHRLLHTIFFTNKRVVQETSFRSGAASTSYASVELVEDLANDIRDPKVLVLGVGEIGADVCRSLQGSFIEDITICNRTLSKAQALAEECGANVVPYENVWQAIEEADIIISSIALSEPFITRQSLKEHNLLSFKYFIDLAVPRSVEPALEELAGIVVYNIDDINNKASKALERRLQAIPDVKAIVHEALEDFGEWSKEMEVSPTIKKIKTSLEQIRQEELERYMKELSESESEKVDKITKSIVQKIIKLPVLQLKAACKRGDADSLMDVLNDLFDLEKQPSQKIRR
ncbi:MAG TPA: glutamyl-tRNA reductase [Microscillaceae bacterium]|nr:glutamyl-tRNA reductase [Microscillaceae bacterium]